MTKKCFLLCILALFSLSQIVHADQSGEDYLILFNDEINVNDIVNSNDEITHEFSSIPAITATLSDSSFEELENHPNVISITKAVNVFALQTIGWGPTKIQAPLSWESGLTGKGVKIAVIDTGIASHPDLVIKGGTSTVNYTNSYTDDNGHGTHVAGIIGARNNNIGIIGVAPESDLYAVKVLNKDGEGTDFDVCKGIDWAIDNNMDIINLSLGSSSPSPCMETAVNKAYEQGILVVGAAGNSGNSNGTGDTTTFPARFPAVISVSAINNNNVRGSFSSTGNSVEIAAPGVSIESTHLNRNYRTLDGTSMAAGFVSGTLALLKENNPSLSNQELRFKMREMAVDLGTPGKDPWYGYGLVQAPIAESNDATILYHQAKNGQTASIRLELFIEGHLLYPNDKRFIDGINSSAQALLNWATQQHQQGHYETAIQRYEFILSAPQLLRTIKEETEFKLSFAKNHSWIITAEALIHEANRKQTASERLHAFVEGYHLFPTDSRFIDGINRNAQALLNWTSQQHHSGNFVTAVDRYEFILNAPKLQDRISREIAVRLSYAKQRARVPTANTIHQRATNGTTASARLELFYEGNLLYANDNRFVTGINNNARSLLTWARQQHQQGNYNTAIQRYEFILQAPVLNRNIQQETESYLTFAKRGVKIP
ncbi:S8 family peptidase [Alkalihalobacterium bogoriense]|uniref:S8 family peptidase n=1 Tax=Alkalihalobacterium bogoriense TaxID=246272 RepID=UPI000683E49B|nr:S8 family peptidase [Alkalihalobacterium bogoriense]